MVVSVPGTYIVSTLHVSSAVPTIISKYLLWRRCCQGLWYSKLGSPGSLLSPMLQSKHLDDEYESSEEEREPLAVSPTWRAPQPPLTVRAQMTPQPPMALRSQVPSRHVLCLPPRNVTLLQERVSSLPFRPSPSSSLPGQFFELTHALHLPTCSSFSRQISW